MAVSHVMMMMFVVPPQFTEMPRDLEVTANGRIVLECEAEGIPTPTISWKINNTDFHRQLYTVMCLVCNHLLLMRTSIAPPGECP